MSENSEKTYVDAAGPPDGVDDQVAVGAKELCSGCRQLDITVERFIIDGDQTTKKVKNSLLPRPTATRVSDFLVKSRSTTHRLGTMGEILAKSRTCPLCSLLIKSISDPSTGLEPKTYSALDAICCVNWEIDGHQTHPKNAATKKGRARRLRVQWNDDRLKDSYLVYLMPEKYRRPNSDASAVWSKDALYLGRSIDMQGGKQALIKSWIDICCKSHGRPCDTSASEDDFMKMAKEQSFFGVIDVVDLQLKPLPTRMPDDVSVVETEYFDLRIRKTGHEPFVALSYVWGRQTAYTTTAKNVSLHLRHGGLEKHMKSLPKAIQDAIQLVHSLGLRYLWVDSLCIVQDRPRSWNLNARMMDLIYGNALITICAADGEDSSAGLVALNPSSPHNQQWEVCAPGVSLMVTRPPETSIRGSVWNQRAWTFQERLLSPRCLIFVDGRVYFQCRSSGMSEDIVSDRHGDGWSLDLVHAPLQMLREMEHSAVSIYANCVELYTSRQMTQAKDVLAAFSGITNYMRKTLQAPFIFGLPSSHFDFALLWEGTGSFKRRRPRTEEEKRQFNGVEFPSWSWCGWASKEKGSSIKYKADMLEGCLINVHQWLLNHTWIRWHIRDGHGKLRPVWGNKAWHERTTDQRWKGYKRSKPFLTPDVDRRKRQNEAPSYGDKGRFPRKGEEIDLYRNKEEYRQNEALGYGDEAPYPRRGEELDPYRVPYRPKGEEFDPYRVPYPPKGEELDPYRVPYRPKGEEFDPYRVPYPPKGEEFDPYRVPYPQKGEEIYPYKGIEEYRQNERKKKPVYLGERLKHEKERNVPWRSRARPSSSSGSSSSSSDLNAYSASSEGTREITDEYGRHISKTVANMNYHFNLTLPEVPYRVLLEWDDVEPSIEFPDQPILQFFTFHSTLNLIPSDSANPKPGPGLCRFDIADDMGDWCGSILLEESWIERIEFSKQEFIAISDAKAFTNDECSTWTYYIPREREDSEWDLYFVLLIEPREWGYQRVALGKVFKAAFADSQWKEIMLG